MIHFFSNHKDTSFLEQYFNEQVRVILHPYIEPEWSVDEILTNCKVVIQEAIKAERLIINGDYTLVAIILLERHRLGRPTGFICMRKLSGNKTLIDSDGKIVHQNVLKPVNVRWV